MRVLLLRSRQVALEVTPRDKLQDEIRAASLLANLVKGHNIGVIERRDDPGFGAKPPDQHFGRVGSARPNRLESDDAVEPLVPGFVNHAHSTPRDFVEQFEFAKSEATPEVV